MSLLYINQIAMFDFNVHFHVITTRKGLLAHRATVGLRLVYERMVPPVAHVFATHVTRIEQRCARQPGEHVVIIGRLLSFATHSRGGGWCPEVELRWIWCCHLFPPHSWNRDRGHHHQHSPPKHATSSPNYCPH